MQGHHRGDKFGGVVPEQGDKEREGENKTREKRKIQGHKGEEERLGKKEIAKDETGDIDGDDEKVA